MKVHALNRFCIAMMTVTRAQMATNNPIPTPKRNKSRILWLTKGVVGAVAVQHLYFYWIQVHISYILYNFPVYNFTDKIFLLKSAEVAVPLLVAGGGGGLGVGNFIENNQQHGRVYDSSRQEISGNRNGDLNVTGGAGNMVQGIWWNQAGFSNMSMLFFSLGMIRWWMAYK